MWQSFKEYIRAVGQRWWAIIGFLVGVLGIISGVLDITIGLPYWAWVIIGIIALIMAQFLAYHKVRKQRDEARGEVTSVISELESNIINLGGQSTNMARLFWSLGQLFLQGIQTDSIFPTILTILKEANVDEYHKAEQNLIFKLRSLQLIHDEQRQYGIKGYIFTITTDLGASVINELAKKWGDSPWPPSVSV